MYEYSATVIKVTDGDTLHLLVDLGFTVREEIEVRLARINAPEMSTAAGKLAKAYAEDWLSGQPVLRIKTYKDRKEKWGRYLADVFTPDMTVCLNDLMVSSGHAVNYSGGKRT